MMELIATLHFRKERGFVSLPFWPGRFFHHIEVPAKYYPECRSIRTRRLSRGKSRFVRTPSVMGHWPGEDNNPTAFSSFKEYPDLNPVGEVPTLNHEAPIKRLNPRAYRYD